MDFNRQESNKIEICKAESLASFGKLDHNNINHSNTANFVKNIKYKGEDEDESKGKPSPLSHLVQRGANLLEPIPSRESCGSLVRVMNLRP